MIKILILTLAISASLMTPIAAQTSGCFPAVDPQTGQVIIVCR